MPAYPLLTPAQLPGGSLELACSGDSDAVARVVRLATGTATSSDLSFVHQAAKAWLASNGDIPFERCLKLPTTPDAFRLMQRNSWICEAAKNINVSGVHSGPMHLANQWAVFISRGPWRDWRDDAEPPEWAAPLSRALFFASRFNRGESLGGPHIGRIARQVFSSKSR
ncbi:MAG: hypothetical protein ABIR56_14235 [Polaromonas sp.]